MKLSECIESLLLKEVYGEQEIEITGIQYDSRKVRAGDLFIALRGFTVDGHQYVERAVDQGAVAVLVEEEVETSATIVKVPDTRRAMAEVANKFYSYPTSKLRVIAITGTNGKTTTSHLIQHILEDANRQTGLLGTIGMKIKGDVYPAKNTTPDVLELQHCFYQMIQEGCEYATIEASSHALDLGRTRGAQIQIAVFTNLTQDHLDYHATMEEYRAAKGLLFSQLGNSRADHQPVAVLNADDVASAYFAKITPAQVISYGIDQKADVRAHNIQITPNGTTFEVTSSFGNATIQTQLIGKFNVYNLLAAITVGLVEGLSFEQMITSIHKITGVDGRFETVPGSKDFTVVVDYAHTPDSLENVLKTVKEFANNRILCVVGCGGDRDRTKRPLMAKIATGISDLTILTSDNPRTEDPEVILDDMEAGITDAPKDRYQRVLDRKEAIDQAVELAQPGDVLVIAGKGHETYQEIHGVRYDFDDRLVAKSAMERKSR
ncbi:UDP-N-acetylmuramoyl-L-alanyl-D-glutamate--2,6-diaminopimelate ligase [Risungbinella massiliensis]|uniref:UDP-N-acetylmuramoyl-L-alanyl-D-glutamate--2, 6-diaminopimelate ligase n=1 Tax=Risungbinella massiliensis TaxID=1329796 RepID=UPI0005CC8872|nr:UDP-N-acetylmuramoyl-L-alanyl-D-glutamate--2,6-diaminopimelate ligase [Risungbinella massiliensis]